MINTINNSIQLSITLILWAILGIIDPNIGMLFISISIFVFISKEFYTEIFIGFLFILVFSDNLEEGLFGFAKTYKPLYALLLMLVLFTKRKENKVDFLIFKKFIPFLIIAAFALFFASNNLVDGIQKTISYTFLLLTVPYFIVINFERRGAHFFKTLIYFIITILVIGILLRYVNYDLVISHGNRLRGIFGNPNGLGIFLILTFIIIFIVNKYFPNLLSKREKIIFYLIILYSILQSGSRTALISVFLFYLLYRIQSLPIILRITLFIGIILFSQFLFANIADVVASIGMEEYFRINTLEEGSGRFIAWKFAWENIQKNIVFGRGFGFDEFLMRSNYENLTKLGHQGGVHNTYLILWLNTGLIGLLAFLRGFFLVFIKAAKNSTMALPAMVAVMFSINFEPWLAASLNPFTILFLVIITIMTDVSIQIGRSNYIQALDDDEKAIESLA